MLHLIVIREILTFVLLICTGICLSVYEHCIDDAVDIKLMLLCCMKVLTSADILIIIALDESKLYILRILCKPKPSLWFKYELLKRKSRGRYKREEIVCKDVFVKIFFSYLRPILCKKVNLP